MVQQVYHGIEPQQPPMDHDPISKREVLNLNTTKSDCWSYLNSHSNKDETSIKKSYCENITPENEMYLSTFEFVMDRTIQSTPYVVLQSKPEKLIYNFTDSDIKSAEANKINIKKGESTCVIMEPMERNTGAIGYLTSKNSLDIVTIITNAGVVMHGKSYVKILTDMKIYKQSLKSALKKKESLNLNIHIKKTPSTDKNEPLIEDLNFMAKQSWTAYMGYNSDSAFF